MLRYSDLLLFLRMHAYREGTEVLHPADFVALGDTVTVWPVTELAAFRLHYFGEEIEKIEMRDGDRWTATETYPPLEPNQIESDYGPLSPGDYVVHPYHGVGIFERIETREVEKDRAERFVSLQYAGNDRLLFPFERRQELMPYIGSRHPRLTRLYSKSWQRTKEKVQKDLIKVARELLKIYAARQLNGRPPYLLNGEWGGIVAAEAEFTLTGDQQRSLREVEDDLKGEYPMDRLLCGDVGYGKTEVALRAALHVLAAGKQVAFIAPTTILAEQHYALLKRRLASLPLTVEHLSRLTAGRDKDIAEGLREGRIDLVIGTHRLLGRDIAFKDLGMLILDEEQKFGVAQKEFLKSLRPSLDVLSLSATPIPRTLSMSLSGLRGLSILRTPPHGRQPVKTEVGPYTESWVAEALGRELRRGGQVYVVHNRVQSLGVVRQRIAELIQSAGLDPYLWEKGSPGEKGVSVAMAHGQMGEVPLAETMSSFLAGEVDVLVASSIVEHGLDSPTANTLIVLHSEWFGLSDLYQLRGRVGRRTEQAYAYFCTGGVERAAYQDDQALQVSENARKRLQALIEADSHGSGWSIAMRDLEIRGGGNILGHEQHGSMEAIGLLLYGQLLQEEIGRQARRAGIQLFRKSEK